MPVTSLQELRDTAPPELRDLDPEDLVREYSARTGVPYGQAADFFGVKPTGTLREMGRQFTGGLVSDLPRMVGQGLQYTDIAPELGREIAQAAEARAPQYAYDPRRGLGSEILAKGARAVPPVLPAMGAAFVPGGQFVAPVVAGGLFGTSSAQETLDKLRAQGISEEDAQAAAARVGLLQGPAEAVATATGLRVLRPLGTALRGAPRTTAGVAGALTDTRVLAPFARGMAINYPVQVGTEVAQDVGTSMIEEAYGAAPEDRLAIARESAVGAIGLTTLLGPLGLGASVSRARRAEQLRSALYDPNVTPEARLEARQAVVAAAQQQGVAAEDAEAWFARQYREDAAATLSLQEQEQTALDQRKQELIASGATTQQAEELVQSESQDPEFWQRMSQAATPTQAITTALQDPEFNARVSPEDRAALLNANAALQTGRLPAATQQQIEQQASEIIGRYQALGLPAGEQVDLTAGAAPAAPTVGLQPRVASLLGGTGREVDLTTPTLPTRAPLPLPEGVTTVPGAPGVMEITPPATDIEAAWDQALRESDEAAAPAVTEPAPAAPVTTFDLARPVDTKVTEKGLSTSVYKALDAQGQPVDITVRRTADGNISRISTQQRAGGGRITQDLPRSQYRAAGTDIEALNTLFSGKLTPVPSTGASTTAPVSPPVAAQAPGAPFSAAPATEAAAPTPPAPPAAAPAPAVKDPFSAAERAELDDTLSNLEATIASEPGAAAGRVTLPQSVLAGLSRMIRTTKNMPPIAYVPKTLSQVDNESTQTYAEQMTRIRDSANKVIDAARQLFNFEAASVPTEQKAALQRKGERLSDMEKDLRAAGIAQDAVNTIQQRRQELRNAVEELRQAAGTDRNVEAVVAVAKGAIQKAQQKTQTEAKAKMEESRDALLSSAWARFKDGSLDAAEAADVVRGREIRRSQEAQEKGVKKPPLVDAATEGYARRPAPALKRKKDESTADLATRTKESKAKWEASKEKGALGILAYIQRHGTGFERLIASAVGRALRNPKATAPSLQWIAADKTPYFDPATNTIAIHETASPEQVLHETLHAALQWWVYNNPNAAEVLKIEAALKRVLDFKGDMPAKAKQVTDLLRGIYGDGKTQQQKLNAVLELVSYGTTLNEFRQFLKTLESDQTPSDSLMSGMRDLWKRITALVQKFLGVNNTVANDVLDGTVAMLESAATEATVAQEAGRTGGRLEAAITSDPVVQQTMKETGYNEADYTRFANKQSKFKSPMQVAFELVGFGRDLQGRPLAASAAIEKGGAKAAEYIRKNMPSVERFILNFNSKFSNGIRAEDIDKLADNFKREFNTGYMDMENVASIIDSRPDIAMPFLDYMDGDTKALDNVADGARFKMLADSVQAWMKRYIDALPETSKEGRFFKNNKFSEYLLFASKVSDVAGGTFSAAKVSDLLSLKKKSDPTIERSWLREEDGNIRTEDALYEVMQADPTNPSKLVHAGFMSREVFNQTGTPKGYTVDTGTVWKFSQFKDGDYQFQGNLTAREAVRRGEVSKLTTAMLNTTAALSHTYASQNYTRGLATLGYENGAPSAGSVVFDSLEDVNRVFGTRVTEENVQNASDEATRSPRIKFALQRSGTWVRLPDTPRYGSLAGKYMPGPVWNAMLDMMDRQPLVNSRIFNDTMRFFKKSKTVYNPGTHVVNIGSNITMMYMHGIPTRALTDAAKLLYKFEVNPDKLTEQDKQMITAFRQSGAMIGQYTNTEVKKAIYDAIEQSISPASDSSTLTKLGALAKFEKIKAGLSRFDDKVSELYAAEDNVFRLAAFLNFAGNAQAQAGGKALTEEQVVEVGRATRKAFLDYDIDARAIRALRQSFLPFVSWSYAIMPVLGRLALYKPWALANVTLAYMMLQAATEDDDDEARKSAPEYLRDRAYGIGPYMHLRVPFLGSDQEPVYFNLGKFNPLFTLFAPPPGEAKLAGQSWFPGFATPSGPFISLISGVFGYDPFTGKPMHAPTDTEWDKLVRTGKAIYDTMAPAAINSRFFTNIGNLVDDRKGITGTEPDTLFLLRNLTGAPFYRFDVTESRAQQDLRVQSIKRDFNTAINKAKREEMRKGYPDFEALDAELADLRKRMEAEVATARGEQPPEE